MDTQDDRQRRSAIRTIEHVYTKANTNRTGLTAWLLVTMCARSLELSVRSSVDNVAAKSETVVYKQAFSSHVRQLNKQT